MFQPPPKKGRGTGTLFHNSPLEISTEINYYSATLTLVWLISDEIWHSYGCPFTQKGKLKHAFIICFRWGTYLLKHISGCPPFLLFASICGATPEDTEETFNLKHNQSLHSNHWWSQAGTNPPEHAEGEGSVLHTSWFALQSFSCRIPLLAHVDAA